MDPVDGKLIQDKVQSSTVFLFGQYQQNFVTECTSYSTLTTLLSVFLPLQVIFTLPYLIYSSYRQRNIENKFAIPALQSDVRTRFNLWVYLSLLFMIMQTIALLVLSTECPLYPYEF
jgi:hypothetical protein